VLTEEMDSSVSAKRRREEEDRLSPPVLLTNRAVLDLLTTKLATKRFRGDAQHSEWIEDKVFKYLSHQPCTKLDASRADELQSILQSNKKKVTKRKPPPSTSPRNDIDEKDGETIRTAGFDLTPAESLQILNFMPTEPVEIHVLIEDLHSRMTERKQEELLALISSYKVDSQPETASERKSVKKKAR
jgi:hypothetical protein